MIDRLAEVEEVCASNFTLSVLWHLVKRFINILIAGKVPRKQNLPCWVSMIFHGETIEIIRKVQVGKDQEKAQSEKDSQSKNRDGKN